MSSFSKYPSSYQPRVANLVAGEAGALLSERLLLAGVDFGSAAEDANLLFVGAAWRGRARGDIVRLVGPADNISWAFESTGETAVSIDTVDEWLPVLLQDHGIGTQVESVAVDSRTHRLVTPDATLVALRPYEVEMTLNAGIEPHAISTANVASRAGTFKVGLGHGRDLGDGRWRYPLIDPSVDLVRDIVKSARQLRTVDNLSMATESNEVLPGWWSPPRSQWRDLLIESARASAQVTFAELVDGRALVGDLILTDTNAVAVAVPEPACAAITGRVVSFRCVGGRVSLAARARAEASGDGRLVLGPATFLVSPDRRADRRLAVGGSVDVAGVTMGVRDVSPRGLRVAGAWSVGDRLDLRVGTGHQVAPIRRAQVIHRTGETVGLRLLPRQELEFRGERAAIGDFRSVGVRDSRGPLAAHRVVIPAPSGGEIVGLLSETGTPVRTAVVIPPAWARTKESFSLLSQAIVASFEGATSGVSVLRIDYRQHRGESTSATARLGVELSALEFTATGALEDIRSGIRFLRARHPGCRVVLIGMSFSAPLCLRVAASGDADGLVQLMGGSDLQDLTRNATGGLDVVGDLRSGRATQPLNILGQYMDLTVSVTDAIRQRVMFLADSQDDAASIGVDLLWVVGERDAFVDPARVKSIVELAPRGQMVSVDCGHVPTTAAEAFAAFAPAVSYLRSVAGLDHETLIVPEEGQAIQTMLEEFEAVRGVVPEPDPEEFWRRYMLGGKGLLGYEVLAMTPEYRELMTTQAELLLESSPTRVVDIGGGVGTLLDYLHPAGPVRVDLFDLVGELVERARGRSHDALVELHADVWDSNGDEWPGCLRHADAVLLSLLLPVIDHPTSFLERLRQHIPSGCRVIASSLHPDVDLSMRFLAMIQEVSDGRLVPPVGMSTPTFVDALRDYQRNASELMWRSERGDIRLLTATELTGLFEDAGYVVDRSIRTFGQPAQGTIISARPC